MEFDYNLIVAICKKTLVRPLWERHLEDMIQHVSMKYWERECQANIEWLCLDYLRLNGFGKHGKQGARALENAMSTNFSTSDEDNDQTFLIESIDKTNWVSQEDEDSHSGEIEEILSPILPNQQIFKWAMNYWKPARRVSL